MKKPVTTIVLILPLLLFFYCAYSCYLHRNGESGVLIANNNEKSESLSAAIGDADSSSNESASEYEEKSANSFSDDFSKDISLEEAGSMNESASKDWWVNSGAFFNVKGGVGRTLAGELVKNSKWQKEYDRYDPEETDSGIHPQNIFRLVLRSKWKNFRQECYYKIDRYILSNSENRAESNGLLLFNRYADENNLYYTGIRVDGTVIIKKKISGKYYTMAQKAFYAGKYDRKNNPNLIPIGEWIGLRSEVTDGSNGTVFIKVYIDENRSGNWKLALSADDNGNDFGGAPIEKAGYAGIRTDFMDAQFDDYRIEEIK